MSFDVVMPQMGESIAEATILKWHRQAGETIGKDETLFEISTDKVDAEIPAPIAGTLLEILVPVNQTVPVGSIVARLGDPSEVSGTAVKPAMEPPSVVTAPLAPQVHPMDTDEDDSEEGRLRTRSSPLVREMARQHGVDLARVPGSGIHGRVTKQDMVAFLAARETAQPVPTAGDLPRLAPRSRPPRRCRCSPPVSGSRSSP
jgi:2-oxoglutarate dehydrogenase E2 component (dihydrolipoamide succinyltransferase)